MKKSHDILGLPVFSIKDGRELGRVRELILNPDQGAVDFLLIDDESWYMGAKVLPFRTIAAIGQHGVTTESAEKLTSITDCPEAQEMLQKAVAIKGNRIMTRTGDMVGVVSEFGIDELTGKMMALDYDGIGGRSAAGTINGAQIITYGRDVLVVSENFERMEKADMSRPLEGLSISVPNDIPRETDAARLFVKRQKQLLLGKIIAKDVKDDQGNVILPEGTVVDNGSLKIAEVNGKLVELSQNAK